MSALQDNTEFQADYEKLRDISLNPARHATANAYEHCEMVRERAVALAELNGCSNAEIDLLADLARVHDIGKISGTAKPAESVALLPKYGITDEAFTNLVKYHDANLPWYQAANRGQPPSDKAWNKMVRKLDVRLLCLFMVADRVDCPGGWRAKEPLVWLLGVCAMSRMKSANIQDHFVELTDPRRRKVEYPLMNVVVIAVCAVICGADDFDPGVLSCGEPLGGWSMVRGGVRGAAAGGGGVSRDR